MISASSAAPVPIGLSWSEVNTPEGRVFYFNISTGASQWDKPEELRSVAESALNKTNWREYKIWDGRSYYYNDETKCSVWAVPPEVLSAQKAATGISSLPGVDSDLFSEIEGYEKRNKSNMDGNNEFSQLLTEKGVTETTLYAEAVEWIKDDIRYHALATDSARRVFFASYITNLNRIRIQQERDVRKGLYVDAIKDLQSWAGMKDSTTFDEVREQFGQKTWFTAMELIEVRKLFDLFAKEFLEVAKLKKQQLQDTYMHQLKADLLSNSNVDLSREDLLSHINSVYATCRSGFWTELSDTQKLVVYKACITQRMRELRGAIASNTPLPSREHNK